MSDLWSKDKLSEIASGFLRSRILLSAAELDVFDLLSDTPRTVEGVCTDRGWDSRATRILLDALTAMGLLNRVDKDRYVLPDYLGPFLTMKGEETLLPIMQHRVRMWDSWSNLTHIVETGENPNMKTIATRDPEDIKAFIGAMEAIGRDRAEEIVASLDISGFKKLLDVGGGSGVYTAAFLEKVPHLRATLFDLPNVVEMAREKLTERGLIDRVEIRAGDFTKDELPPGHDAVLLSAIIHMNSPERNRQLYEKAYRALEPGGTILIRDHVMNPTRDFPVDGAIFAVNMLVATRGGNTYTFGEIEEDLESAGFHDVDLVREGVDMDQIVRARK